MSESLKWIQQFRTIVTLRLFMQQDNVVRLNIFVEGWLKYIICNHTWLQSNSGLEGSLAELAPCSKIGGKVRLPRYLSLVTNSCIAAARNPRLSPNCSPHSATTTMDSVALWVFTEFSCLFRAVITISPLPPILTITIKTSNRDRSTQQTLG